MPADGVTLAVCQAVHASAVAIDGRALLIRGPSRAGKSRLALALIGRSDAERAIAFVGDDRILLRQTAAGAMARPHPRIAGFIERRGLGLVAHPWVAEAVLAGVVELGPVSAAEMPESVRSLPRLALEAGDDATRADRVLAWWVALAAARASHVCRKQGRPTRPCAQH